MDTPVYDRILSVLALTPLESLCAAVSAHPPLLALVVVALPTQTNTVPRLAHNAGRSRTRERARSQQPIASNPLRAPNASKCSSRRRLTAATTRVGCEARGGGSRSDVANAGTAGAAAGREGGNQRALLAAAAVSTEERWYGDAGVMAIMVARSLWLQARTLVLQNMSRKGAIPSEVSVTASVPHNLPSHVCRRTLTLIHTLRVEPPGLPSSLPLLPRPRP